MMQEADKNFKGKAVAWARQLVSWFACAAGRRRSSQHRHPVLRQLLPQVPVPPSTCSFASRTRDNKSYQTGTGLIMGSRTLLPVYVNDKECPGVAKLLDDMKKLMMDKSTSDVILLDQDEQPIHAHRIILKNRCSAFQSDSGKVCDIPGATVFTTGTEVRIRWPHVCVKTLRDVVAYVYTGIIEILDNNVFQVLAVAHDMGISELEEQSRNHISENMSVANALIFLPEALRQSKRSNRSNNDDFLQQCTDFIGENASECLKSPAFLELDNDSVIHIVSSDTLAMAEEDIWRSVLNWARSKTGITESPQQWSDEQRKRITAQLSGVVEHVRILQIDSQVFAEEVEPTGAVPIQIR